GPHVLPVFMTEVRVAAREHLPDLHPYRAEVTILLEVIEGKNPLYDFERKRQLAAAAGHSSSSLVSTLSDWLAI
ncbi:MAG: hypothetical protein MJE77_02180, partial [Proteobacteria bacterium]|nr:hypothetical protein [Pseudomonadota bacterium]